MGNNELKEELKQLKQSEKDQKEKVLLEKQINNLKEKNRKKSLLEQLWNKL